MLWPWLPVASHSSLGASEHLVHTIATLSNLSLCVWLVTATTSIHDWVSDWSRRGFHDPFDDCDEPSPPPPAPPPVSVPAPAPQQLPTVREEPELAWNFWQEEMRIEAEREQEQESQQALSYSTFSSPRSYSSSIAEPPPLSPSNPFLPYLVNQQQQQQPQPQQHQNPPEKPASFSYMLFSSISSSSHEDQAADDQETNILNANFHDFFTWSKSPSWVCLEFQLSFRVTNFALHFRLVLSLFVDASFGLCFIPGPEIYSQSPPALS